MFKKFLLLPIILISLNTLSQESNFYHFKQKKFEVKEIYLRKYSSVIYRKDGGKLLTGIIIRKYNENDYQLTKLYDLKKESHDDEKYVITPELFNDLVKELRLINIDNINSSKNFNIYDGTHYTLIFRDINYTVTLNVNSPGIDTKKRGLERFLALSQKIWNLSHVENKK